MAECIKRDVVMKEIMAAKWMDGYDGAMAMAIAASAPAADVAPVVHGRWIHSRYEDCSEQFELVKCSQCNHEAYAMAFYVRGGNYCPNCGAKMDGGADNA